MSLDAIIRKVAGDHESGASSTLDYVIGDLLEVMDSRPDLGKEELSDFALRLYQLRSGMAPVFHLSNLILMGCESEDPFLPERLRGGLFEMRERERSALASLASNAANALPGSRFLTLTSSSSVNASLIRLSQGRQIRVLVAESLPGGEGRQAAALLSRRGIEVEVIRDSMVFEAAKECDAGVTGADSVSPAGVVNKVGTYALAQACAEVGAPCFLLASWSKCVPSIAFDEMSTTRLEAGARLREQVFEIVPLTKYRTCISEKGAMAIQDMLAKVMCMPIAKAWERRGMDLRPST